MGFEDGFLPFAISRSWITSRRPRCTTVEVCAIPYDHLSAAAKAAREGREDWAEALRSGRNG